MKTQNKYVPVSNDLALVAIKEHKLMVIKKSGAVIFRIMLKAILYAFILTIANVII